jgi:hypothetical protein
MLPVQSQLHQQRGAPRACQLGQGAQQMGGIKGTKKCFGSYDSMEHAGFVAT